MLWITRAVSLAFLIILAACGGGGSEPQPPAFVVSNLVYTPTAAYVNSGQVTVSGTLSFANASGGISSVTIEVLDSAAVTVSSLTTPVPNGAGITSGVVHGDVVVATDQVGLYTVRVTARDLSGRVSNAATGGFRVSNRAWVAKTPMPNARDLFALAESGGRIYVMGGEVFGTGVFPGPDSAVVDVYDVASDSWSAGVALTSARRSPAAAALNGVIYVFGGSNAFGDLATVEAFDTASMTWTVRAPMPTPRSEAAAAVVNAQICIIGGINTGQEVASTECFDPSSNTWSVKATMPGGQRRALGAAALNSRIYAIGGHSAVTPGAYLSRVERFDLGASGWSTLAPMPTARRYLGVASSANLVFALGGENATIGAVNDVQAFDPSTAQWRLKTSMPTVGGRVAATALGTTIFVFDHANTLQYTPADDIL